MSTTLTRPVAVDTWVEISPTIKHNIKVIAANRNDICNSGGSHKIAALCYVVAAWCWFIFKSPVRQGDWGSRIVPRRTRSVFVTQRIIAMQYNEHKSVCIFITNDIL